jgi:hypothetical protein
MGEYPNSLIGGEVYNRVMHKYGQCYQSSVERKCRELRELGKIESFKKEGCRYIHYKFKPENRTRPLF